MTSSITAAEELRKYLHPDDPNIERIDEILKDLGRDETFGTKTMYGLALHYMRRMLVWNQGNRGALATLKEIIDESMERLKFYKTSWPNELHPYVLFKPGY